MPQSRIDTRRRVLFFGLPLVAFVVLSATLLCPPAPASAQQENTGPGQEGSEPRQAVTPEGFDEVRNEMTEIKGQIDGPAKDTWDKWGAIAPIVSGALTFLSALIVAVLGFYGTQVYSRRQREREEAQRDRELKNLEVQTVEKFFPHLSSTDEHTKEAAIQAIASLGNEGLATNIACIFGGAGANAALSRIASALPDSEAARGAEVALGELFSVLKPSIVRIEHVVSGARSDEWRITMAGGRTVPATVQRIDRDRDLAIIESQPAEPVVPLKLTPAKVALGAQVIALGHSLEAGWRAVVGTVSDLAADIPGFGHDRVAINMSVFPGFSGAPSSTPEESSSAWYKPRHRTRISPSLYPRRS
jgi:S1-C subfamily serine protease